MRNAGYVAMYLATDQILRQSFGPEPVDIIWSVNHLEEHDDYRSAKIVPSFCHIAKPDGRWRITRFLRLIWWSVIILIRARMGMHNIPHYVPWREMYVAYVNTDAVLSCPGNFLYTSGRVGAAFMFDMYALAFARWLGKPLYMLPQTLGPIEREYERRLLRWLLPAFRLIFVRDTISQELCHTLCPYLTRLHVCPDLAFAFHVDTTTITIDSGSVHTALSERPVLGVTALNWGEQNCEFSGQDAYEAAIAEAVHHFITHYGGRAVFFAHVQGPTPADDDRRTLQRILQRLDAVREFVTLADIAHPASFVTAYQHLDIMLGSRLHSCILALTVTVPVLAIAYQYKTPGVLSTAGLDHWYVPITGLTATALCHALDTLWVQRADVRKHIAEVIPNLAAECVTIGIRIRDDYHLVRLCPFCLAG